ncbi:MAG: hypothetical protein ACI4AM_07085 [Muribaculaceae bacterium]
MKITKIALPAIITAAVMLFTTSCGRGNYEAAYSPEETGLGLVKITDESKNVVVGTNVNLHSVNGKNAICGSNKGGLSWDSNNVLAIAPNGAEIAYLVHQNGQNNIMVRRASTTSTITQRTFRDVDSFWWGSDDNLYYNDITEEPYKVCSVNSHSGTLIRQHTSNKNSYNPALSKNGKILYFEQYNSVSGFCIWSINLETGELANCAVGYQPCPIGNGDQEFLCVRNNSKGNSEIWRINYITGEEQIILSDAEHGFGNPQISPDGNWILFTSNAVSSINKRKNVDIFVCKIDGSNVMQLTYHPAHDICPRWNHDGTAIYFISNRITSNAWNIWRMNFNPNGINRNLMSY